MIGLYFPVELIQGNTVLITDRITELNTDTDQKILVPFRLDETVGGIEVQARAGTVGATAGTVTVKYNLGYA